MADIIDRADERIDAEMAARLKVLPRFDVKSLSECTQCGDDIPYARQILGGVTRCFDCQNHFEVKSK